MKTETPKVQVIPVGQPVGPLHWQMSLDGGPPQGPKSYPVVPVGKGNDANLTFTIDHPGNITFAKIDPIYVQPGTAKPTSGVDSNFKVVSGAGTKELVVHDSNGLAGTYTYVLNFEHGPRLDPIVQNGGGGGGRAMDFWGASATQVVGVLLVLVVAALLVRRAFR
jgi:hypothetical protein